MRHWFAHLFGWNTGFVVSLVVDGGKHYIGFKCNDCELITGVTRPFGDYWIPSKERSPDADATGTD